jgi:hypothetical protein
MGPDAEPAPRKGTEPLVAKGPSVIKVQAAWLLAKQASLLGLRRISLGPTFAQSVSSQILASQERYVRLLILG